MRIENRANGTIDTIMANGSVGTVRRRGNALVSTGKDRNDKRETILSAQNRNLHIAKFTQSYLIAIFLPLIFGRFKKKQYICSVEWCNHAPHKPMKHKP